MSQPSGVHQTDITSNRQMHYPEAIPILLSWLPRIDNLAVKEDIVRALSVPWAKPVAARPLLEEFKQAPSEPHWYKWAIGNAMSVVAPEETFDELVELVLDEQHGEGRSRLVDTIGRMRNPRAVDVLIQLLGDRQMAHKAAKILGRKRVVAARPLIVPLLDHPDAQVRVDAGKAIERIDAAARKKA